MNLSTNHLLALVATFAVGVYIGRQGIKAGSTGAKANTDAALMQDWWTYAGSWA